MEIFLVWIVICLASESVCDKDHLDKAIYVEQSPPLFASEAECQSSGLEHLYDLDPVNDMHLVKDTQYQIDIECEMIETPL